MGISFLCVFPLFRQNGNDGLAVQSLPVGTDSEEFVVFLKEGLKGLCIVAVGILEGYAGGSRSLPPAPGVQVRVGLADSFEVLRNSKVGSRNSLRGSSDSPSLFPDCLSSYG